MYPCEGRIHPTTFALPEQPSKGGKEGEKGGKGKRKGGKRGEDIANTALRVRKEKEEEGRIGAKNQTSYSKLQDIDIVAKK